MIKNIPSEYGIMIGRAWEGCGAAGHSESGVDQGTLCACNAIS
jgi:hypothetical protein